MFFLCSKGLINTPAKLLTPITQMTWLLKETQLNQLHLTFKDKECTSLQYRANIAAEMNLCPEIVHKWYEHNKLARTMTSRKRKAECECDFASLN